MSTSSSAPELADARARAIRHLRSLQADDGHWREYDGLVGGSDQWVTAYVALALAEAGETESPRRAAAWLAAHRYPRGWGFNGATGPDADSTAFALLLMDRLAQPLPGEALDFLETQWRPAGGFATYPRADGWGQGHPCVTPTACEALWRAGRPALLAPALRWLASVRRSDGTWPAYWWRSGLYTELVLLRLLRTVGSPPPPRPEGEHRYSFRSVLELACIAGIEALRSALEPGGPDTATPLALELAHHQRPDGSWPGGWDLRVVDPDGGPGTSHLDAHGLITGATCLRALAPLPALR